jgi:type IV pilus biogenesis protein CpaD/CtpE
VEKPASFGCANGANLVVMAHPEDLAAGRPLAPGPGALEAAAIARLLSDKVKDLRREGTESAGGGNQ